MLNQAPMRLFTIIASVIFCAGCTGDLIEIGPNANHDMATSGGAPDLAQGGGGEMGPTTVKFIDIQHDLDTLGCTNAGCHGGTQKPVVKAMATSTTDLMMNYMDVLGDVNAGAPDQSLLLTKPLTGSGVTHSGTKPFMSTQDPVYQRWLNWIKAGTPQ